MKINELKSHLKIVLIEMCMRVGANYDDIDCKKDDWYYEHEWTREEEDSFIKWLADYLYTSKEARLELTDNRTRLSIYRCKQYAISFVCCYGWRIKK
jgi:hypothetical protein